MKNTTGENIWRTKNQAVSLALYADWATEYEADLAEGGYVTTDRIAGVAADLVDKNAPVLDYRCGPGMPCHAALGDAAYKDGSTKAQTDGIATFQNEETGMHMTANGVKITVLTVKKH